MKNKLFKKLVAGMLVMTMVFGLSVTAYAEEAVTSGGTEGAGTSEGHVEESYTEVTLPTDAEPSVFDYMMDPERLIATTSGEKYSGKTFPEASDDTGVYFLSAENTYSKTSKTLEVTNESSHDIALTVKAGVKDAKTTDIPLAASSTVATDKAELYLGLIVGTEDAMPLTAEGITKTVTIAGTPTNFEVKYDSENQKYVYGEIEGPAAYKNTTFGLEGAVSEYTIADDTTAPTIELTWSWVDPNATAAPSILTTDFALLIKDTPATITVDLGVGELAATAVTAVKWNGSAIGSDMAVISGTTITLTKDCINYLLSNASAPKTLTLVFNDAAETTKDFTLSEPTP